MRCHVNRVRRWGLWPTIFVCGAFAACTLIAATTRGQEGVAAARGKPEPAAQAKTGEGAKKPAAAQASATQAASPEQAIRRALQMKSNFDFHRMPLTDVIEFLKNLTGVEIKLDKKALDGVGIAADQPVSFSAQGISVQAALELMLRSLGLTWTVSDEVLLVTTPEQADSMLETRVYEVQDLVIPMPSYRFKGMYVPGMFDGGSSGISETGGGMGGMGGGMGGMGGGMGGMGGGMGGMGGGMGGSGGGYFSVPDHPQPAESPSDTGVRRPSAQPPNRGGGGGASGAGGGSGGMAGRTVPQPMQSFASGLNFDFDSLIDVITSSIEPLSWDQVGGPGSIAPLQPCMLVISQTQRVHRKIEKFFEEIRAISPGLRTVTIRATWLLLDLKQLNQLLGDKPRKEAGIDRKALEELAAKTKGYIGAITCFNGQTVHIASGRSRSAVVGAIPVVGGGGEGAGYQPIINNPNSGAVLQVTPLLLPNTQAAMLDLQSVVTRSEGPTEPIHFLGGGPARAKSNGERKAARGGTTVTLDRIDMLVEQLATTLKVLLGEPTLVGGLSREHSTDDQEAAGAPQLYLFIEATAKQ